jgi:hypothetical protein
LYLIMKVRPQTILLTSFIIIGIVQVNYKAADSPLEK